MNFKTSLLASIALIAFAGNSVLCRLALESGAIDPASFTTARLISGAAFLYLLVSLGGVARVQAHSERSTAVKGGWLGAFSLFVYAASFSFAYLSLDTGVGALVLFGSVQVTMVASNAIKGTRLSPLEVSGLILACAGLVYLVYPELSTPSLKGFMMMTVAGIAWGVYTLHGQGSTKPLRDTSSNFIKSVPLTLILLAVFANSTELNWHGVSLAIASGVLTSGIGYAIWYATLPRLNSSQAGVLQLLVPVIAALGGVIFSNELLSVRLIVAGCLTLGGIFLVLLAKKKVDNI